jgi:hypothetical protein
MRGYPNFVFFLLMSCARVTCVGDTSWLSRQWFMLDEKSVTRTSTFMDPLDIRAPKVVTSD